MQIEQINFEDLTDDEKENVPNNGSGKEYVSYVRITRKGETILLESDAMEPEDCSFGRDLCWIVGALNRAYECGVEDGRNSSRVEW